MKRSRPEGGGLSRRFFYFLLGLAGLGVGVWLFGRRRRGHRAPQD